MELETVVAAAVVSQSGGRQRQQKRDENERLEMGRLAEFQFVPA